MNPINVNGKYKPLWESDVRYYICTGGRGSGKSFAVDLFLSHLTFERDHRVLFTRYTMSSAHLSIIPEFVEKVELLGAESYFNVNKTEVRNEKTGVEVLFRGIKTSNGNQTANLKSLQGMSTWVVDEAEELVDEGIFDTIDLSIRNNKVQNRVVLILNPTTKEHWIYKRFFQDNGVTQGFNGVKGDVCYIHTDYRDNIGNLSDSFIAGVERMRSLNPTKYNHKILGGWLDKAEGVIFENWRFGKFDETLPKVWGQDYGYSNDPTTLVKIAVDRKKRIIYLDESLYKVGLVTDDIYDYNLREAGTNGLIVGDNAEPRLISELRSKGLNIKPCLKMGVAESVRALLDFEIVITERSKNLAKELNNYSWSDKRSETPVDTHNHLIDAVRYGVIQLVGKPNDGKYFVY